MLTEHDLQIINHIMTRAQTRTRDRGKVREIFTIIHTKIVPLNFKGLLSSDDGTFGHDYYGILKYINLENLSFDNAFRPRCVSHVYDDWSARDLANMLLQHGRGRLMDLETARYLIISNVGQAVYNELSPLVEDALTILEETEQS